MKKQQPILYDEKQLADLFGVTDRRIRQLVEAGCFDSRAGQFDVVECSGLYIGWLRRDEEGARTRRRANEYKAEVLHRKLQRDDALLLTPDELANFGWQLISKIRIVVTSLITTCFQQTQPINPQAALESMKSAEGDFNHLLRTLVEPFFEEIKKHATDDMRLKLAEQTRCVRSVVAEHGDLLIDNVSDPDEIPYSSRTASTAND